MRKTIKVAILLLLALTTWQICRLYIFNNCDTDFVPLLAEEATNDVSRYCADLGCTAAKWQSQPTPERIFISITHSKLQVADKVGIEQIISRHQVDSGHHYCYRINYQASPLSVITLPEDPLTQYQSRRQIAIA